MRTTRRVSITEQGEKVLRWADRILGDLDQLFQEVAGEKSARVKGSLSSNHGEIAVQWASEGRGIVLRSHWDVAPLLTYEIIVSQH